MARNKDFDWSAIDELVWPSCRRPMMLGARFIRNIWLLVPGMEEHELDSRKIKFEVGAFIPLADADRDERLRLGVDIPGDIVGTDGIGREGRLEVTPVEYDCFDKPEPEWWISGSEYRFIGKKVLGVEVKIVEGFTGGRSMERRIRGDRLFAPLVIPRESEDELVGSMVVSFSDSSSDTKH